MGKCGDELILKKAIRNFLFEINAKMHGIFIEESTDLPLFYAWSIKFSAEINSPFSCGHFTPTDLFYNMVKILVKKHFKTEEVEWNNTKTVFWIMKENIKLKG